tara:strand:- start:3471 stop:4127 length:657 start_codon:yes stop_codon:yes gene_type:complete
MKKEIEIIVPTDWSAISLKTYMKLQRDLKNYEDTPEAYEPTLLYHICGITPDIMSSLDSDTLNSIRKDLTSYMAKTEEYELQRRVTIGDVEYGFEPNISQMAYGAYLDISKYESIQLDENWTDILSILYRPIVKKSGALYEIEKYNGVEPWESDKWLSMGMDFHFGSFFFFSRLSQDLLNSIQKSTESQTGIPHNIKSILVKSGKVMHQFQHSQKTTS